MNYEFKRIKKRKFEDVSNEEIDKWREQIEGKIRNMQDVPSLMRFYRASNEVLPSNLDTDSRRKIIDFIVRNLAPEVKEMIKVEDVKAKAGEDFTDEQREKMRKGAWAAELREAKIVAGKGKGLRRITPRPPKEKKKKSTQIEDQLDLFTK